MSKTPSRPRKRLVDLELDLISVVDVGAQGKGADIAIIKRSESEPTGEGKPMSDELKALEAKVEELTKSVSDLDEQLAQAKAYGELTDTEKAYHADQDEAGQAAFLAKSAEERKAIAKAAAGDDEGTGPTVIYKSQVTGKDYTNSEAADLAKQLDDQHFEKRATEELPNFAKSVRGSLFRFAEAKGEEFVKALKGADSAFAFVTKASGHSGDVDEGDSPNAKLEKRAKEIAKRDSVSIAKATTIAMDEDPELANAAAMEDTVNG